MYTMTVRLISAGFKGISVADYYVIWLSTTSGNECLSVLFNVSSPLSCFHTPVCSTLVLEVKQRVKFKSLLRYKPKKETFGFIWTTVYRSWNGCNLGAFMCPCLSFSTATCKVLRSDLKLWVDASRTCIFSSLSRLQNHSSLMACCYGGSKNIPRNCANVYP